MARLGHKEGWRSELRGGLGRAQRRSLLLGSNRARSRQWIGGISCLIRGEASGSPAVARRACPSSDSDKKAICHLQHLRLNSKRIMHQERAAGCGFWAHPYLFAASSVHAGASNHIRSSSWQVVRRNRRPGQVKQPGRGVVLTQELRRTGKDYEQQLIRFGGVRSGGLRLRSTTAALRGFSVSVGLS